MMTLPVDGICLRNPGVWCNARVLSNAWERRLSAGYNLIDVELANNGSMTDASNNVSMGCAFYVKGPAD